MVHHVASCFVSSICCRFCAKHYLALLVAMCSGVQPNVVNVPFLCSRKRLKRIAQSHTNHKRKKSPKQRATGNKGQEAPASSVNQMNLCFLNGLTAQAWTCEGRCRKTPMDSTLFPPH